MRDAAAGATPRIPPAAIVIAGGRGTRMGGIDKPGLALAGATLRERVLAAAQAAGLAPVIHVGPEAGDGPAAALDTGLAQVSSPEVVVLAGDLVRPDLVVAALLAEPAGRDGTVLVDPDGRAQWLAARYRVAALRAAIAALSDGPRGAALRAITGGLELVRLPVEAQVIADVDTWDDYETAKQALEG